MASIIGGEHVGIAVQNGQSGDVVGFDEIGDFGPLITVDRPMIFIGRRALASASRGVSEICVMKEAELIGANAAIIISMRLAQPGN